MEVMRNPWLDLPSLPPFVAPVDAPVLERLSSKLRGDYTLRLDLLPQPWTGSIDTAQCSCWRSILVFVKTITLTLWIRIITGNGASLFRFKHARRFTSWIRHSRRLVGSPGGTDAFAN